MIEIWRVNKPLIKIPFKDLDDLLKEFDNSNLKDARGKQITPPTDKEFKSFLHLCLTRHLFFVFKGEKCEGAYV